MIDTFTHDVFLSHSAQDKPIVRELAGRLKKDGLRVWLDEWEIRPGDSIPAKVEEGLERSRVLVLCMSANAFGSDWARLEAGTFRFRDPLNRERRFIPLRLDDAPIKGSLAQFLSIEWRAEEREREYEKLLDACRPPRAEFTQEEQAARERLEEKIFSLSHTGPVRSVAFSPDGKHALSGSSDKTVRLWAIESGRPLHVLEGHSYWVLSVAWSPDSLRALSGSSDKTVRLWEIGSGRGLRVLEGHSGIVASVAWSPDGCRALSGSHDKTVRLWDVETGRCLRMLEGHSDSVWSVAWSPDGRCALSGSSDKTMRLWDLETGLCLRVLEGHSNSVLSVAWSSDGRCALSGSSDKAVRLWDLETGRCLRVLEGHSDKVWSVAWSPDSRRALSGSHDKIVRLWDIESGRCLGTLEGHIDRVWSVAWSPDNRRALSGSEDKTVRLWDVESGHCLRVVEGQSDRVLSVAWSPDGRRALSRSEDSVVRLWDLETGCGQRVLEGQSDRVLSVAWSPDGCRVLSGSEDSTVRLWDLETGRCLRVLEGHSDEVLSVAWSPDGHRALSGSEDSTIRLWDIESGRCLHVIECDSHKEVLSVAWSPNSRHALSGSRNGTVRLWNVETGRCLHVLKGHSHGRVLSVAWSPDGRRALSGCEDRTVRLWDVKTGRCLRVLEGHSNSVLGVAWSPDNRHALSGSEDKTLRLWDVETGRCLRVLEGHSKRVLSVAWSPDGRRALSGAGNGVMRVWDTAMFALLSVEKEGAPKCPPYEEDQIQYTNAKVLLVGESGVGKTGLAKYLALGIKDEERNPSTDGAWATQWTISHSNRQDGVDREIWLWDFAGQVDYRLVHQLFMDETAAAVLVFNPQNENPYEGLGQWDRDLQKATRKPFTKLLAAGRIDRGGLVVSDAGMNKLMAERGFRPPLHRTSAKTGEGCDTLRHAIVESIDWDSLPITTSLTLYHRIKEEILRLRDAGTILIRLSDLNQRMGLLLTWHTFTLAQLQTALGHLAGPGIIQPLEFGGFILLQPEVISRYAAALVRKVRRHAQELGCISEEELLAGVLDYQDFVRLPAEDETVVLRALHHTVVSRAWCLRQLCDGSSLLTFPSYFRRERQQQLAHPRVLVTYRFTGPVDEIYATLVVRLHHTTAFESTDLWKDAVDFKTQTGAALGLTLTREGEGTSRLDAYFAPDVDESSRVLFLLYIDKHLKDQAGNVVRLRHYFCGNKRCDSFGEPFLDQAKIDKALGSGGKGKVFCPDCGKPIPLRDLIEAKLESPENRQQVRQMQVEEQAVIDNESRELLAVHHSGFIVAEAGQIYRGYTNSDHGIDAEIEFKDDQGRATGKRLYLQLKSGDSYLNLRQRDGMEVFQIKNPRWTDYWQQQAYPVMLVIRTSDGDIRWMDVSAWLKRNAAGGKKLRQIIFEGERFDALSVRRWRDRVLGQPVA